tara:strand:+ start:1029 stop:1544 length:516 start_codon:yes stop_codon:yes gene_type:complete
MALGDYKPDITGGIKGEKREKQQLLREMRTLQTDPRALGLTESEREREAFAARRLGGAEAEAKSRAQTLGLSKQLEQQKADQIRARMERRAAIARDKKRIASKTGAKLAKAGIGAATNQPGMAMDALTELGGEEVKNPTSFDQEGFDNSLVGKARTKGAKQVTDYISQFGG